MKGSLTPVHKNRLHEEIIHQLQRKIFTGEYREGEKLPPERILAEQLSVNRATVREALKKMEILGLVEIRHGDGLYVKDYLKSANLDLLKDLIYGEDETNYHVITNLLEVRRILVPEMAHRAAEKREQGDLEKMRAIIGDRSKSVQERDIELHSAIARASRNLLYIFMHNFFSEIFADFGYLYFADEENRRKSEKFHQQILKAIAAKNPGTAKKIMKDVLIYAEEQTGKSMDRMNTMR